jgi:hypothetical protein
MATEQAIGVDLTAPLTFQERANLLREVRNAATVICGSCRDAVYSVHADSEYGFVCGGCRGALAVTRGS